MDGKGIEEHEEALSKRVCPVEVQPVLRPASECLFNGRIYSGKKKEEIKRALIKKQNKKTRRH